MPQPCDVRELFGLSLAMLLKFGEEATESVIAFLSRRGAVAAVLMEVRRRPLQLVH